MTRRRPVPATVDAAGRRAGRRRGVSFETIDSDPPLDSPLPVSFRWLDAAMFHVDVTSRNSRCSVVYSGASRLVFSEYGQ
jgi:hypothetical protein